MGVSVYVLPLKTYLTGRFRTTWETRSERAGAPGFRMTSEGVDSPRPLRMPEAEAIAAVRNFRRTLQEYGLSSEWEEEGPAIQASTLSYSAYERPCLRAKAWSHRATFEFLIEMAPPEIWLPEEFTSALRVPAPWGTDQQVTLLSAPGVRSELAKMLDLLSADPRREELGAVPEGGVLSGLLSEFADEFATAQHLARIAGLGIEHRTPVIVEG